MKIYQVQLKCFHLEKMKKFYTETLGMESIVEGDGHFAVMAGTTKLIFEKSLFMPSYHVCFRTGSQYFEDIYKRLAENGLLLPNEEGERSLFWGGKQCYFVDPDGNILEMFERTFSWGENYNEKGWHDIGEIGWPVKNVKKMQEYLSAYIQDVQNEDSENFAFFGDSAGVFVIVKEGRHWYPTERVAEIHPIKLVVSGEQEARFKHEEYPYEVIVKKEWNKTVPAVQFRIARPTNQLDKLVEFYEKGVGLKKIGEFRNHEGYDGIMLGLPDYPYHLEFTQHETNTVLPTPTKEHLLVFYIPNRFERDKIAARIKAMGHQEVEPENPYWGRGGVTFEDPDGWRIVLMNTTGI
ncbi:hypothetical protein C0966_04235 [Bacillus methanolicus]|nr:hypothetical protein [Bacillus methanolicus]